MAENYRYIGKTVPRKDAVDVVTGQSLFVNDRKFQGLLHGKVLRSPHPHAIVKKIDTTKAERLKGVMAIVTWENCPDWRFGNPPIKLLEQKVRYVGAAVAIVAAESEKIAEEATKLIDVKYDILPAVLDDYEAMKPGAPQLYADFPGNLLPLGDPIIGPTCAMGIFTGDVEKGFSEADVIIQGNCGYDNIPNANPIEPPTAVVHWEEPNRLTAWVSGQGPHLDKWGLSLIIGDDVEVRAIGGPCGGSFGSKFASWQARCYAAALSRVTKRPVRVAFSKKEHLACFVLRPATRLDAKIGMKKDGTVTAIAGDWLVGTGYYSTTTQGQVAVGCGEAMLAVRCKNWHLQPKIICTNRNASGAVRGFGGQELKCALFPLMSRAMEKLGLDPFDVMKKNFVKPGDGYFWRDSAWYDYRGIDYSDAMDKGAEAFGWKEKWKGWLVPTTVNGSKRIGVGVGVHGNADIGEDVSEAYVRIDLDGRVVLHAGLSEPGTGQKSNAAKCVAEVLKVPLDTVSIVAGDTSMTPFEFGPAGSRGTYAILSAAILAAEDARKKLLEWTAPLLEVEDTEDLDTADGVIWRKSDPSKRVVLKDKFGIGKEILTITGYGRFVADFSLANCMMSFVELQVDTETGKIDLLRVVNATDVGKVIDPLGLKGQLDGCLGTAGIDSAIFEETIIDRTTGHMLNANMIDYKWRTTADLPAMDHVVLETPIDSHRFRAVGVGEISTSPGPSAILMAASNAIGVWMESYPVTPEKVLKALGKIGEYGRGV